MKQIIQNCPRWFGHVQRRLINAHVKKVRVELIRSIEKEEVGQR